MTKIRFLDTPFYSHMKCGISPAGATLVSGLAGAGSSILGGIFGLDSANSALDANLAENERNRQFNASEAVKNRQFQAEQASLSRYWNQSEWSRQFGLQQDAFRRQQLFSADLQQQYWLQQQQYNSPQNIAARLHAAGANPSAALNAQTFGSTGISPATSSASPSVPSVAPPPGSAAAVGLSNPAAATSKADSISKLFSGIASLTSAVASSTKDNALADQINQITPHVVEGAIKDNNLKDLIIQQHKIENEWLPQVKYQEFERLVWDTKRIMMESILTGKEVDTEDLRQQLLKFTISHEDSKSQMAALELGRFAEMLEERIALIRSMQQANKASASANFALSNVYSDQHAFNTYERHVRGIASDGSPLDFNTFNKAQDAFWSSLDSQINDADISLSNKQILRTAAENRNLNMFLDQLGKVVGMGTSIGMARTGASYARSAAISAGATEQQAQNYSRWVDSYIQHHSGSSKHIKGFSK